MPTPVFYIAVPLGLIPVGIHIIKFIYCLRYGETSRDDDFVEVEMLCKSVSSARFPYFFSCVDSAGTGALSLCSEKTIHASRNSIISIMH